MKAIYFDCSSGISGNMVLGALLEIIEDNSHLLKELQKLNIEGYQIQITKKTKNEITGTYVEVILDSTYHQPNRNLYDIVKIIEESSIDEKSKQLAKKMFEVVAKAESKVHNKPLEKTYFHEQGAIDSIVDIVGTAILINKIKPDKILSSIVNDGHGFISCKNGILPVPVPATSEIFANVKVPFKQIQIDTELVTPTGATIISQLAQEFTILPTMKIEKIGWGVGYKDLEIPNILKVYYGQLQ